MRTLFVVVWFAYWYHHHHAVHAWTTVSCRTKQRTGARPLFAEAMNRRDFASTAAAAAAAAGLSTSIAWANDESAPSPATRINLPPMGLGTWAWGDNSGFWDYSNKDDDELRRIFDYGIRHSSPLLVDTAEIYGSGRSETLVGQFAASHPTRATWVATKFAAWPIRTLPLDVVRACQDSIKRLGRPIDLYQIHFPNAWSNAAYWDGLALCYEKGLVRSVGVSNYGVEGMRACHDALAQRGIPLATNQTIVTALSVAVSQWSPSGLS